MAIFTMRAACCSKKQVIDVTNNEKGLYFFSGGIKGRQMEVKAKNALLHR